VLASEQPASEQYAVRPMHADPVFGLRDFLQRLLLVWLNSYPSGFITGKITNCTTSHVVTAGVCRAARTMRRVPAPTPAAPSRR
jgi:hypothetical protein